MDQFTEGYITCAFWSSLDDDGTPLDELENDPAPETIAAMERDCAEFQTEHADLLKLAYSHETESYSRARAGHDFWLTRNGHGAGFWDRGLGDVGDKLTAAAHAAGSRDLYIGDDGLIYQA